MNLKLLKSSSSLRKKIDLKSFLMSFVEPDPDPDSVLRLSSVFKFTELASTIFCCRSLKVVWANFITYSLRNLVPEKLDLVPDLGF